MTADNDMAMATGPDWVVRVQELQAQLLDVKQKLSGHELANAMLLEQLAKAKAEITRIHATECAHIYKEELDNARKENARLEAALQRLKTVAQLWNNAPGEVPYHCWEVVNDISKAATSAAVHQLLGPIEDALEMGITSVHSHPEAVQDACRTALSRLRKVIGEKA